jgi:hypothetical protein
MKKLPARHAAWVMPLFLSLFMTGIVSFISTYKAMGFVDRFASAWWSAWGVSWLIAFPAVMAVLPLVKRLTAMLVDMRAP